MVREGNESVVVQHIASACEGDWEMGVQRCARCLEPLPGLAIRPAGTEVFAYSRPYPPRPGALLPLRECDADVAVDRPTPRQGLSLDGGTLLLGGALGWLLGCLWSAWW